MSIKEKYNEVVNKRYTSPSFSAGSGIKGKYLNIQKNKNRGNDFLSMHENDNETGRRVDELRMHRENETQVEYDDVQQFFEYTDALVDRYNTDIGKRKSADQISATTNTINRYYSQLEGVREYYKANASSYENYDEIVAQLDSIDRLYQDMLSGTQSSGEYYATFDSADEYNLSNKYYGMSSSEIQAELDRLTSEGAIYTTRAATDDEIAIEAARLDAEAENTLRYYRDAYEMWRSGADGYDQGVVDEYRDAARRADAQRAAFYSGLQATGGWEVTEITGNMYQDEIDWLTGYKGEVSLQETTRAATEAAQQEMETAEVAAIALESVGLYKGERLSEEEIAQMDADLLRVMNNARLLYETAYSSTTTSSSQVVRYKRELETAEANYNNFIAALPYIVLSSLHQKENDYINDIGSARADQNSKTTIFPLPWQSSNDVSLFKQGGLQDWRQYTFMTEAERAEYNRLWNEEGEYVASAYLESLTDNALNARYGYDIAQGNSGAAKVGAQIMYGFKDAVGNITKLWSDKPHEPAAWEYASEYMMDGEDSWINWLLQKAAHWAGGEAPSWLLKRYAKWFTGNNGVAQLLGDLLGGIISIGEAYEKAKERGYTGTEAQFYGIVEGIGKSMIEDQIGLG